jgi:uncharacterized protein YbjT (DUF2867 family)
MILITGATGRTGGQAARDLAGAGVELAVGDAADAAAVRAALRGVTRVAVSFPNGGQQGMSEQHIRATGCAWTMVRPSFYMQNFLANAYTIKTEGKFHCPFGEQGAAAFTDSRDAGAFTAQCLATPGHESESYDVTSPDRLSFHEVAEVFSRELGRKVEYVPQDPAAYKAHLGRFLASRWHLDAVCDIFAEIAAGCVVDTTDTFPRVMRRPATMLAQFIHEHRAVFTA